MKEMIFKPVDGLDARWIRDATGTIVEAAIDDDQDSALESVVGELSLLEVRKFKQTDTPLFIAKYFFISPIFFLSCFWASFPIVFYVGMFQNH